MQCCGAVQKLIELDAAPLGNSLAPTGGEGRGEGVRIPTKLQIPPNPLHIRLLGAQGIVMKAHDLPDLIKQPRLGISDKPDRCGWWRLRRAHDEMSFPYKSFLTRKKSKTTLLL
jgi:hypothetical protein